MGTAGAISSPLSSSAKERRRQIPVHVLLAGVIAWTLQSTRHEDMVLPWLAWATGALIFEFLVMWPHARRDRGSIAPLWSVIGALAGAVTISSVFSAIALIVWMTGGRSEATITLLIITGGLLNNMASGVESRPLFLFGAVPYLLALLLLPVAALIAPMAPLHSQLAGGNAELPILTVSTLVSLYGIYTVWARTHSSLRSETAALAEAGERLDQAQAAMADRAAMAAIVSHELRTPVSAILAGAQMIHSGKQPEQTPQTAELIVDAGRLMAGMLNDLLDHSKMEARAMTVEMRDFDLAAVVKDTLRFWATPAMDKGLALTRPTCNGDPVWLVGDPHRMRQILNNLMSNAIKFTASGEVCLDVALGEPCDGKRTLAITVRDSGPGVPPESMERLFTPFAQGSAEVARTYGGTGLGLKVSRDLARLMGGDLSVQNADIGAAFTLELVLAVGQPVADDGSSDIATPQLARRLSVLAVDDHELNRRTLGVVLQPLDVDLVTACDGHVALELLDKQAFDVVLMDVNMPGIDGNETTRRLRTSGGRNANVPVIGLSAGTEPAQVAACMDSGMTDWLPKPLEPARLYLALQRVTQPAAEIAKAA